MKKGLIIVESPSKAKTISKFLNNEYEILSSVGHIRDLPKKTMGVDIENNFKPKYVNDKAKSKIIKMLKDSAKVMPEIFLASDHDREGEAIAWHLTEVLKKEIKDKKVHRIIFNEITKSAIQAAIKDPGKIDQDKVDAQQARRILDRVVGYTISPVLWKVISKNLSAGRVQSVALRLICEREEQIKKFEPKEYWSITNTFKKDNASPFNAELTKFKNKKIDLKTKEEADKIFDYLKNEEFVITKMKDSGRKIQPSPAYITSTLQQDAARLINFSPKKTMMIAQQLYEGIEIGGETTGLITYMRSDSLRIANEAMDNCRALITERYGKNDLHSSVRVFKNKNSSQDAHEAIRPTDSFRTADILQNYLSADQLKLYTLIWERFVATQMKPVQLKSLEIEINGGDAFFKTKGSSIVSKGFTKAYDHVSISLGEVIDKAYAQNDALEAEKILPKQHFTKPPGRYSESSLIKELESKGIGRPSTFASITSTIIARKYVELQKKRFFTTDLGEAVNKFLVANFENLFNVSFTAQMEDKLDDVTVGKSEWTNIVREYYTVLQKDIEKVDVKSAKDNLVEETDHKCEKCGSVMVIKWGKNGKFLACSNYPECKNIKNFTRTEDGKIVIEKPETLDEKCPKCGGDLMVRNGRFGRFISCTNYPKCKFTKPYTIGIKCPECEDGQMTEKKTKTGKYFYSCNNYPNCKYSTWNKPLKIECPSCGNYYVEEVITKSKEKKIICPKCKHEIEM